MISILSTNITTPLGFTTEQNYLRVRNEESELKQYHRKWGLPETFVASMFSDEQNKQFRIDGLSRFEALSYYSIKEALERTDFEVSSSRVIFILSTTKGNIELLGTNTETSKYDTGTAAQKIAEKIGITTLPIVVCNACISGVSAQLLAQRMLESGKYDYAIVCGADCLCKFTVSGFQSLKALSHYECKPFDIERTGLNLGEGAATIIFSRETTNGWNLIDGAVRNDAYHISSPSPVGEGSYRAMKYLTSKYPEEEIAMVCVHGTATMYNDQMESKAIDRAQMSSVPASALKGYFGHTMGAAGILESILTMRALDDGIVLKTKGFEEIGVSGKINIALNTQKVKGNSFIKLISGFGGNNGALLFKKIQTEQHPTTTLRPNTTLLHKINHVHITQNGISDGVNINNNSTGKALITNIYRSEKYDYPKYFKMDGLSRLAFISSQLLVNSCNDFSLSKVIEENPSSVAIILFNKTSSIVSDCQYIKSISNEEEFYPSPSIFVYTLPNISVGEIAIKNNILGETSFYILPYKDDTTMETIISTSFADTETRHIITGWIDYSSDTNFEAELSIYSKEA